MRLHHLAITAFGPFADRVVVDFEALADSGLFLLHGPTGAGKTTVLDAVCFALYGTVPGARAQAGRLRSDHADEGTRTSVVLEVTLRGRRLTIERSPAWDRPKRRGSGSTREQAKILLTEHTAAGPVVLSTRLDEAGHLVRELVGMTCDQFCQVVLLPQGQFAEFLRADAEARRPLLEQLFGTERFSRAEQVLADRRRSAWRAVEEAAVEIDRLVARVAQVVGTPAGGADLPDDVRGRSAGPWAAHLLATATSDADSAVAAERHAAAQVQQAKDCHAAAADLSRRRRRAGELTARHSALAAGAELRRQQVERLARARRAAPVAGLIEALAATEDAALSAATRARAAAAVPELAALTWPGESGRPGGSDDPAEVTADALRSLAQRCRDELAVLAELAKDQAESERLAARLAELEGSVRRVDDELLASRAVLARGPQVREALAQRVTDARSAEQSLPAVSAQREATVARSSAAGEAVRLRAQVVEATAVEQAAHAAVLDARETLLAVRVRRLDGMAAELAASLRPDEPCPVCGSVVHPAPAASAAPVAAEQEQGAQARVDRLASRHAAAARALATVVERLAGAESRVGWPAGDLPAQDAAQRGTGSDWLEAATAELARAVARLDAEHGSLVATAAGLAAAVAALERHDLAAAAGADAVRDLELRRARLAETRLHTRDRLHELAACLDRARGEDASVSARRTRLTGLAAAAERAAEAYRLRDDLELAVERHRETATTAAVRAGFTDLADARRSLLEPGAVDALARRVEAEVAELAAVTVQLADPELAGVLAGPAPDERACAAALHAAEVTHLAAATRSRRAAERVHALELLVVELLHRLDGLVPLRQEYDTVDALSKLVEGTSADNALRMRLSAYVLAARLEQVAAAATERLVRMSGGRYTLVHTDEAGGGRGRSGLGLRVCDAWTGVERDTRSLSGGESFIASLALALGLADVVTGEAGGAPLDTLFVDEGFGSLDDETLEEVVDVLDALREGGRVVGVVSHVSELRARIPVRLHVRRGTHGSTVCLEGIDGVDDVASGAIVAGAA